MMMRVSIQVLRPRKGQRGGVFNPRVLGVGIGVGPTKMEALQDAVTAHVCGGFNCRLKLKPGDMIQIIAILPDGYQETVGDDE